jgi:hypothetical protein
MKSTIGKEEHNAINFLDLKIYRNKTKPDFVTYRKHIQLDTMILSDSYYPHEYYTHAQ